MTDPVFVAILGTLLWIAFMLTLLTGAVADLAACVRRYTTEEPATDPAEWAAHMIAQPSRRTARRLLASVFDKDRT